MKNFFGKSNGSQSESTSTESKEIFVGGNKKQILVDISTTLMSEASPTKDGKPGKGGFSFFTKNGDFKRETKVFLLLKPFVNPNSEESIHSQIEKGINQKLNEIKNICLSFMRIINPKEVWDSKMKEVYGTEENFIQSHIQYEMYRQGLMKEVTKEVFEDFNEDNKVELNLIDNGLTNELKTHYFINRNVTFSDANKIEAVLIDTLVNTLIEIKFFLNKEDGHACNAFFQYRKGSGENSEKYYYGICTNLKALTLPTKSKKDSKLYYSISMYSQCFLQPSNKEILQKNSEGFIYGLSELTPKEATYNKILLENPNPQPIEKKEEVKSVKNNDDLKDAKPIDLEDLPF